MMALYSIGTWDTEAQAYTPQIGVPAFNLTLYQLRQSMRMLQERGYSCHRTGNIRNRGDDNDTFVLIERTDGKSDAQILDDWKR